MVSVVIATYNRAKVISETIQSILDQTYSDLELIVVSDGSQDDTRQIIEGFRDRRLKYYEISHSGRPAVPRNFAIKQAKGEYIAFCDDDDIWLPEKLELQMAKMREDKEIGLVYTKCLLRGKRKSRIVPSRGRQGFIFKELFLSPCFITTSTVLIKREVIKTVGMFDEDMKLKAVEDFDLWLKIALKYKIGFVNKSLIVYNERSDGISKGFFKKLTRHYLIAYKFYKGKQVNSRVFIETILRVLCKSFLGIIVEYGRKTNN